MYSDWFCLIGVEYIDINGKMIDKFILTDIISYVKIINREYMSRYYFTIFGQLNHTFYGDPDENLLREAFEKIACKFPSIEIKCYLSSFGGEFLKLFVLRNGVVVKKDVNLTIKIDKHDSIKMKCFIKGFNIPNNITQYVNKNYDSIYSSINNDLHPKIPIDINI